MIKTKGISQEINETGLTDFEAYPENNRNSKLVFAVNNESEGLWIKNGDDYKQILGTSQFSMPASKGQRRQVLVKLFNDFNY